VIFRILTGVLSRCVDVDISVEIQATSKDGLVYAIGPNLAQGDEMNRASKLGEDIARANETLLTESAYAAVVDRDEVRFEVRDQDDLLFPFYRATRGE
jgi:hypothetical protein